MLKRDAKKLFDKIESSLIEEHELTSILSENYIGLCLCIDFALVFKHRNLRETLKKSLCIFNGGRNKLDHHYSISRVHKNTERIIGFYLWRNYVLDSGEYKEW